jgi:hypothetical protein
MARWSRRGIRQPHRLLLALQYWIDDQSNGHTKGAVEDHDDGRPRSVAESGITGC